MPEVVEADVRQLDTLEKGLDGAVRRLEGLIRVPLSVAKTRPPG
jgi:hypothetical protein